jgi:hypothetical protein
MRFKKLNEVYRQVLKKDKTNDNNDIFSDQDFEVWPDNYDPAYRFPLPPPDNIPEGGGIWVKTPDSVYNHYAFHDWYWVTNDNGIITVHTPNWDNDQQYPGRRKYPPGGSGSLYWDKDGKVKKVPFIPGITERDIYNGTVDPNQPLNPYIKWMYGEHGWGYYYNPPGRDYWLLVRPWYYVDNNIIPNEPGGRDGITSPERDHHWYLTYPDLTPPAGGYPPREVELD